MAFSWSVSPCLVALRLHDDAVGTVCHLRKACRSEGHPNVRGHTVITCVMCYHCYHIGYSEICQRKYCPPPSATCLVVPLCGQFLTRPYSNSINLSISYGSTIHLQGSFESLAYISRRKKIVKGLYVYISSF